MVKLVAEIGCNHKGDFNIAKNMIAVAASCGADVVKFQKRNNMELLGIEGYNKPHPVPSNSYGKSYGLHRDYLEFDIKQHTELKNLCKSLNIIYSVSVWDIISTKEMVNINPEFIKIPSATNLNFEIHNYLANNYKGKIHISLGMTSEEEINSIINFYRENKKLNNLVLYACTSGYPVPAPDLCLLEIEKIMRLYGNDINAFGFSGHHNGIAPDIAALTIGQIQGKNIKAKFEFIERHFTLDRTWKGTDHAASLEPEGLRKLCRDLKNTLSAISYKKEDILDIEKPTRKKLKDFGKNQRLLNNVTAINILSVNENNIEKKYI